MQAQGMKISNLWREMNITSELVRDIQSNRKWSEINDVTQRTIWLQNECGTLVADSRHIARQSLEQVRQKLLCVAYHNVHLVFNLLHPLMTKLTRTIK